MIKKELKKLLDKIKREIFGESARGEKVIIPDLKKLHTKLDKRMSTKIVNEDFNRWCNSMNFGGMYVKK
jgi:hypothetical protein